MNTLRGRPREPEHGSDIIGVAIGVFGALVLSVLMLPLRTHLHNDNMALALVVPVLIGAVVGGRLAGAIVGDRRRALLRLLLHAAVPLAAHRGEQRPHELLRTPRRRAHRGRSRHPRRGAGAAPRARPAPTSTACPRHRARRPRRRHRGRRLVGAGRAHRPVRPRRLHVRDRAAATARSPPRHPRRDRRRAARRGTPNSCSRPAASRSR